MHMKSICTVLVADRQYESNYTCVVNSGHSLSNGYAHTALQDGLTSVEMQLDIRRAAARTDRAEMRLDI